MPGRFELTSTLAKIWHAPDHFRLLDPLPPMHRRGIIAGFLLVIIGILLPSDDSQSPASTSREANLNHSRSPSRKLAAIRPFRCRRSLIRLP